MDEPFIPPAESLITLAEWQQTPDRVQRWVIDVWAQNNQYGKRINAQLDGVQFVRDGEPFGEGGISVDAFDAFGDDDDDFLN